MQEDRRDEPQPAAGRARSAGRPRLAGASSGTLSRLGILKLASELFAERGFVGTTMAEIADAAGIRGPSLYYHFKDKAEILRALADVGLADGLRDSRNHRRDSAHSAPARLYQLVHELVLRLKRAPYDMSVLFDPVFRTPQFSDVDQRIGRWVADVEAIVKAGMKSQDFVENHPWVTACAMRGIVMTAVPLVGASAKIAPEALADQVAGFALRALLRNPDRLAQITQEFLIRPPAAAADEAGIGKARAAKRAPAAKPASRKASAKKG